MHLFPLVRAAAALLATLAPSVSARLFTVNCAPLTIQRGDPIVSPGAISSHVHAVVGGTAFALSMSEQAATAAKATTCDKLLDKSNYWQPQLYHQTRDARFELVPMQGAVQLSHCPPPAIPVSVTLQLTDLWPRPSTTSTAPVTMPGAEEAVILQLLQGRPRPACAWSSAIPSCGPSGGDASQVDTAPWTATVSDTPLS